MKYCTKCGKELVEGARFCNACGASVATPSSSENPYANHTQSDYASNSSTAQQAYTAEKSDEQLRAEEQALLDQFNLGLKHERLAWKIMAIVYAAVMGVYFFIAVIFACVSLGLLPAVVLFCLYGVFFLPCAVINFYMCNRLTEYRNKLYTDCTDGIGHYSVGSIVFSAFFNNIALIFIIIYFIKAKCNTNVIERIKARQDKYNSL